MGEAEITLPALPREMGGADRCYDRVPNARLPGGDERGSQRVWHDGGINGFYAGLSRYPDDRIAVALLTNRESSPDPFLLTRAAAQIAREGS